jgi:hypothetical protein
LTAMIVDQQQSFVPDNFVKMGWAIEAPTTGPARRQLWFACAGLSILFSFQRSEARQTASRRKTAGAKQS